MGETSVGTYILLLTSDIAVETAIVETAAVANYGIQRVVDVAGIGAALDTGMPALVILDIRAPREVEAAVRHLSMLAIGVPVLLINGDRGAPLKQADQAISRRGVEFR